MTVLVANSTPIVGLESIVNESYTNLAKRLVLPTPESPIITTLYKKSNYSFLDILSICSDFNELVNYFDNNNFTFILYSFKFIIIFTLITNSYT